MTKVRRANRRLNQAHEDPCNADRALRGAFALACFASVTGQREEVAVDPETVLGDLLADLMHWCDVQKTKGSIEESIDFESALERARNHHKEEYDCEKGTPIMRSIGPVSPSSTPPRFRR
jgi:hypothetical protein